MAKPSSASVYARVGRTPEERLRWLLKFGNLEPASLDADRRAVTVQEARAFLMVEEVDPEVRALLRIRPPPIDETPNVLTQDEVWAAQRWLQEGLERLRRIGRWNFAARVRYELDFHRGRMLWVGKQGDLGAIRRPHFEGSLQEVPQASGRVRLPFQLFDNQLGPALLPSLKRGLDQGVTVLEVPVEAAFCGAELGGDGFHGHGGDAAPGDRC